MATPGDPIGFVQIEADNGADEEMESCADQLIDFTENVKIKDLKLNMDGNRENRLGVSCETISSAHKACAGRPFSDVNLSCSGVVQTFDKAEVPFLDCAYEVFRSKVFEMQSF
ncbi:hypothetical protein U1Q18_014937 [Sarracenia purpurea var. burkii]